MSSILRLKMTGKKVGIIGAGVSGLASIKSCVEEGLSPVCWEQSSDIGGLWNYTDEVKDGYPSLYNSCVINSCKEMTCYSDFPIPKEFPNFMSHRYFKKYLDLYAQEFQLRQHIKFNTSVQKVEKSSDFKTTGHWVVTSRNLTTGTVDRETVEALLICNGHLHEPNIPNIKGLDEFKGTILHTREYKDFRGFENKRVFVVGIGNSGTDIACEISRHAQHVFMSSRRGAYVIQRTSEFGQPFDQACVRRYVQRLPNDLMRPIRHFKINYRYNHANYGFTPDFQFDAGMPTISDDLPTRILVGAISVHTNVAHFTENDVVLQDGSVIENIDAVILATGFNFSFPFLDDSIIRLDGRYPWLYKLVFPTELDTASPCSMAVVGLVQPFGALPPILEMQSRVAAKVFSGNCRLPSREAMRDAVVNRKEFLRQRFVNSPRYMIQVYFINYLDTLAEMIGCKPNLWRHFLTNPKLWYKIYFGPATPPQWRLDGPGQWHGAAKAIAAVEDKTYFPMKTRVSGVGEKDGLYDGWIRYMKYVFIIILSYIALRILRLIF